MTIDGCRAKLRRAQEHRDDLDRRITDFLQLNPYRVAVERNVEGAHDLVCVVAPTLPQEQWATIIGDCVHNTCAALDYLAWEVAGASVGDRETMFPIFDTQ